MIMNYRDKRPNIKDSCYVASTATVIGDVTLDEGVSVWFGTVIRGDKDRIEIGKNTNIQDNATLHTDPNHILTIGNNVTIGHNAIVHGCIIEDEVLVGMGAIILNGAHIGKHCIIGANALVTENQIIPDNSVVIGSPARVFKKINDQQLAHIKENAVHYAQLGMEYKQMEETNHG